MLEEGKGPWRGGGITARKENDAKDLNTDERISKFGDQLKNEHVYRIPIRYFTDLGKINFLLKTDFTIECHLETDIKNCFNGKKYTLQGQ